MYLSLRSLQAQIDCFDAGTGSSNARFSAIGHMLSQTCLFDEALKFLSPKRSKLTKFEHILLGATYYGKWRLIAPPQREVGSSESRSDVLSCQLQDLS